MTLTTHVLPRALLEPELDSVFWTPSRTGVMSAWWGHVPFAHWIAGALRPQMLVELGTHNGVSFAAFCEGMQRRNVAGRCYAVDTWQGDEHAGNYDQSVFRDFSTFNKAHYGAFAELMQMTFDEAVSYFADGSIDLLHIDGLHTYDAVKSDYTNWLPKLSDKAVVLFHDINVRERDFGVWKLWDELKSRYPSFEFRHSHGLGILAVGREIAPPIAELCSLGEDAANLLRDRFAQLGTRWVSADLADRTGQHAINLAELNEQLKQSLAEHQKHVAGLEADRTRVANDVRLIQTDLADRAAAIAAAHQIVGQQNDRLTVQAQQIESLQSRMEAHSAREAHAQALLKAELNAVYSSRSWRITAPLRAATSLGRSKPTATQTPTTADPLHPFAEHTPTSPDQKKNA